MKKKIKYCIYVMYLYKFKLGGVRNEKIQEFKKELF